jgi:serine/threonine protein kinase/tetratricopeptide (TPR) repeat protein
MSESAGSSSEPIQRLGDFEIIREIGRGGMGVVYEARQVSLNRKVALKVLSGGLGLTPKAVQRFRREAEAAAKLHHTNIVPVYATGEESGTHFYAMELIDGPSLDHVIRQLKQHQSPERKRRVESQPVADAPGSEVENARSPNLEVTGPYVGGSTSGHSLTSSSLTSGSHYFDTVARMIAEVADALEYAHQHDVIHRDIKPSNLLLSHAGRLSVNDFGLARMLEQPGMTMTGEFVGTPAYMSPEQVTAGRIPLDHRTDIYSLGATLYELLTLTPPFPGQSRELVLAQIVQKEPKAPRRVEKRVPVDLETICLKCLEKDPDRRYQTAGEVAKDLRRYVNRFAISARRAGPVQRLVKWVKRHPGLAAGVSLAIVAILFASFFAVQSWRDRQARLAGEEAARQKLLTAKKHLAEFLIFNGQFPEAETAIAEAEALGVEEEWSQWRRGLIAFHRGEETKAYELLKQAVARMPDNVAATCLMIMCAPSWEEYGSVFLHLDSLAVSTPEDYLYKGLAQSRGTEQVQGLSTLSEGLRQHDSLIARVLRAQVRAAYALETTDLAVIDAAKADAKEAQGILRGNPQALLTSTQVYFTAAGLYSQTGQEQHRRDEALKVAREDARELSRFPELPNAALVRAILLQYDGKDEAALNVLETAVAKLPKAVQLYVLGLYRRGAPGDVERAIEILKEHHPEGSDRDWLLTVFLAEVDGPGPALEYLKRRMNAMKPDDPDNLVDYYPLLFLLGERGRAIEAVRKYTPNLGQRFGEWQAFHLSSLDYMRNPGPATMEKMLQAAGRSNLRQCWAHWFVACALLGSGDREGARLHFEACVATHLDFQILVPHGCRSYAARMKKDRTWPPWIAEKK